MQSGSLLPKTWEVPAEFRHRLGDEVGRQRVYESDGQLLLVLHRPPKPDEDERRANLLWLDGEGLWRSHEGGRGADLLTRHLDEFESAIEQYHEQEEKAQGSEEYFEVINGLAPVVRAMRHLHAVLQEARKLNAARELLNARDRAYAIERRGELLLGDARTALEFAVALRAEEQAKSSHRMSVAAHRLNLLVAFFFPIATLSGIFGSNLDSTLGEYPAPWPFLAMLGVGIVLGMFLLGVMGRRPKLPR